MYTEKILLIFILLIISIVAQRDKKKICIHNLVVNGTNLISGHRKQLLVVGITNFNNQSSRIQANRYNDLSRELERNNIRNSIVQFILINEQQAAKEFFGNYYDRIRIVQDNPKDRLVRKLTRHRQTISNYVFGRCGYLIFTQEHSHADLDDAKNYQELLRIITIAVKNKRPCQNLCS